MQSFLEKTVVYLVGKYGDDISDLCIVLPNRRAGLFLKTHFAKTLNKTFWAPEIMATEDFVALLSELQPAETITLLFELYETIKKINPENKETFDDFSKWGQTLINDFNEIDRYLVDAKQLFGNLKDIKELETWSLNADEELTVFQQHYLNFWQLLGTYYTDFNQRILTKHMAHQGLAYRIVAEKVEERVNKHPWKRIIFAGFNALNKAEEVIIEKLLNIEKAEIIWDMDAYYVNNKNQEAGRFYRKYNAFGSLKKYKDRNTVFQENLLSTEEKNIFVLGAAKNVAQAKVAGSLVSEIKLKYANLQNTAVVLADENLLFPVLHSLPENLQDINVTMGYPLKNTPVSGFFDLIFNLHLNGSKIAQGKSTYSFYHKDLLKLLAHPYSSILVFQNKKASAVKIIQQLIQDRNIVFAAHSTIEKLFNENNLADAFTILSPVFKHWEHPNDAITCLTYLIEALKNAIVAQQQSFENKASLELEYLFAFTKIIKRIQALMLDYPNSIGDLKTLYSLFKQIVRTSTLPFYGEPLMGLQVMGMLETRTLDFENIVLISCNEDILPSGKTVNSFIPFELKRYFGLPTYSDKDAIFAYHFYRLLQRAKNIYLLYNTESDALGSGEKSRFLTQLLYELPKVNPNVKITEQLVNIPIENKNNEINISIPKSEIIFQKLMDKAQKGFSPSVLNTYRNCSLQFYFQVIVGLKEAEEVKEVIGADKLGSVIHEVLEKLFTPFIGKHLKANDIADMKKNVEGLTYGLFEALYGSSEISYGKNLLALKVALKFIHNFLDTEIQHTKVSEKEGKPLIIKSLEEQLETVISVNDLPVKLHGKADRIDLLGKTIRIIDYKTGIANNNELRFDDWEQIRTDAQLSKSFQLLMYGWLYKKMNPGIEQHIISGIITFRELSAGLKTVKVNKMEILDDSLLANFELQLKEIFKEIFNPHVPFSQTTENDNCNYCSFKGICNR